jgi:16S rRNA (cytidine1402-2'-O)-methyltransferase
LLPKIINYLKENLEVVLISESGMPVICDPGNLLVTTCIKKNFPFTVIPSGSAFATALVYSGFNIKHFAFFGFLPKKHSQLISQIKLMQKIKQLDQEMIFGFYESPKRIKKTLEIIAELWPDVQVSLAREMTKKFEEILRGDLKTMQKKNYKGEITVIMK